ncbi:sugar ABC transporter ATP-binding protein [Ferruginibacter sp. SUN106]|uniref:sugar ABC transporter ATP-binding protein n=1 Tax=Ferruginibacter sp. SUN106 TaxID=2978348 RepID=UPI003D368D64
MLVTKNITKKFPGVTALENVNLQIDAGKVTAVIGENGAGKSTLMKILSGVYTDYEGQIIFKDKPVNFSGTAAAQDAGIAIIHQELNLIPYLSITENIFLGRELVNAFGLLDKRAMHTKAKALLHTLHLDVEPDSTIASLKVGQQQMVEIAKALLLDADLIIMDEPTSAITEAEVDVLFTVIDQLRKENKAIVYISHKLNELFKIADKYIVLRDGKTIESGIMSAITHDELIKRMVGREIQPMQKKMGTASETELLRLENICQKQKNRTDKLSNISFTVNSGEIVGIFGLMGAGRTELLETIFGLHPTISSGNIFVNNKKIAINKPADAIHAGIVLLPEDRKKDGLVLGMEVKKNISLPCLQEVEAMGLLNDKKETTLARKHIQQLGIKTPSENQLTKNLSGGNQQKIVLAKWLERNPKILLLDEPTRGIDVNAKNEMYKLMQELVSKGMSIIMVSSELTEILTVSNRILVMAEGKITATIPYSEATEDNVLKAAIAIN